MGFYIVFALENAIIKGFWIKNLTLFAKQGGVLIRARKERNKGVLIKDYADVAGGSKVVLICNNYEWWSIKSF